MAPTSAWDASRASNSSVVGARPPSRRSRRASSTGHSLPTSCSRPCTNASSRSDAKPFGETPGQTRGADRVLDLLAAAPAVDVHGLRPRGQAGCQHRIPHGACAEPHDGNLDRRHLAGRGECRDVGQPQHPNRKHRVAGRRGGSADARRFRCRRRARRLRRTSVAAAESRSHRRRSRRPTKPIPSSLPLSSGRRQCVLSRRGRPHASESSMTRMCMIPGSRHCNRQL